MWIVLTTFLLLIVLTIVERGTSALLSRSREEWAIDSLGLAVQGIVVPWLPEELRPGWLPALGVKESPELPVQALVAPSGQVACVIQGAVEERDYPAIAAFVGARR